MYADKTADVIDRKRSYHIVSLSLTIIAIAMIICIFEVIDYSIVFKILAGSTVIAYFIQCF